MVPTGESLDFIHGSQSYSIRIIARKATPRLPAVLLLRRQPRQLPRLSLTGGYRGTQISCYFRRLRSVVGMTTVVVEFWVPFFPGPSETDFRSQRVRGYLCGGTGERVQAVTNP